MLTSSLLLLSLLLPWPMPGDDLGLGVSELSRRALTLGASDPPDGASSSEQVSEDGLSGDESPEDEVSDDEFMSDDFDDLFEDTESDGSGGGSGGLSYLTAWKGFFELRPRVYLRDRGEDSNDEQLIFEGELELDFRISEQVTAYLRPRVFVDLLDGDLRRFEPLEGYVTVRGGAWDLRLGQFIENWGIVDTYNPIDVVNRRDFASDLLDADRLGELGVRGRWLLSGGEVVGEPTFSFYWLPVWRETLFAPDDQRFSFDTELVSFEEDDGFEPEGAERGFYAVRLQHTLNTGPVNADVQYLYARGPERLPAVILSSMGTTIPAYYGVNTVGFGFRAVPNESVAGAFLASLTLKAEVVYKDPYDFSNSPIDTPDDYVACVIGVDREFYDLILSQDQLTLTLEYAREDGADDATARLRPFLNDIILRTLWEANDFARTSVELRGFFDFENEEKVFEAIFERQLRQLHEDLKLSVQLQLFDPPKTGESLFDFFPNSSSLAVGLRLDF